jgi:diguanylate cyclase
MDNAVVLMDKIRESLASAPLRFKDQPVQITMSIGLAEFAQGDTIEKVFARADRALYQAKEDGRNCCRTMATPSA